MVGETQRREIRQPPHLLQSEDIYPRQAKEQGSCSIRASKAERKNVKI